MGPGLASLPGNLLKDVDQFSAKLDMNGPGIAYPQGHRTLSPTWILRNGGYCNKVWARKKSAIL